LHDNVLARQNSKGKGANLRGFHFILEGMVCANARKLDLELLRRVVHAQFDLTTASKVRAHGAIGALGAEAKFGAGGRHHAVVFVTKCLHFITLSTKVMPFGAPKKRESQ